jgi:hypothetical protein
MRTHRKLLALLLTLVLAVSLISGLPFNAAAEDDAVYLAFTSDVHYEPTKPNNLKTWLDWLQTKVDKLDAIGYCGDIGTNDVKNDGAHYWETVQDVVDMTDSLWNSGFIVNKPVYIFGNHEWYTDRGGDLPAFKDNATALRCQNEGEALRTEDYIIYSFGACAATPPVQYNEQDIAELSAYLDTVPNDMPVIILTHFPLFDNGTTKTVNADKVIEVFNKNPNIICFWGHYHSVFGNNDKILTAGSMLPVGGKNVQINFTYLQAGCMTTSGTKKSGTLMEISGDDVTFERYDITGALIDEKTITITPFAKTCQAVASDQKLTVDGKPVAAEIYNIGGANYFKLRDVAAMLSGSKAQFSVGYDDDTKTIKLITGEAYQPVGGELTAGSGGTVTAVTSGQPLLIDGKPVALEAYNIGGSNFFKLRDLGTALGFGVDYDDATKTMLVTTAK